MTNVRLGAETATAHTTRHLDFDADDDTAGAKHPALLPAVHPTSGRCSLTAATRCGKAIPCSHRRAEDRANGPSVKALAASDRSNLISHAPTRWDHAVKDAEIPSIRRQRYLTDTRQHPVPSSAARGKHKQTAQTKHKQVANALFTQSACSRPPALQAAQ